MALDDLIKEATRSFSAQLHEALEALAGDLTSVTHTYDWTALTDETRLERARATTPDRLRASLDRLAELARNA